MSVIARSQRRFHRAMSAVPAGDLFARVFDRWANLLVTRDHGKGAPSYQEGTGANVYAKTQATGALPGSPNASAPAVANIFDLTAFGGCCLYWRPSAAGAATHTDIDVAVWAQADSGNWVRVATSATLLPYVEIVVNGTGYRQVFVQVSAVNGGVAGNIDILAAGD
jgi:hypothetical protein